jgi:ribosomal protein S18 acetylase RimI-like enzyme/catechol 2,3-dioxygenase-like lactoylglutathione lyase family enzyme
MLQTVEQGLPPAPDSYTPAKSMTVIVRQLVSKDAEAYVALRGAMLVDSPAAFLASPEDDIASNVAGARERLAEGAVTATFGAFAPALVGAIGMYRDRHVKAAHKAHVWGMFVTPQLRRQGIGRRLLEAAIAHASRMGGVSQLSLSVSAAAPEAQALYESAGFRVWGTEPGAIRHAGKHVDEHHMVLFLDTDPNSVDYKLRAVRVFTVDLERSLDFYERRLGLRPETVSDANGYALFRVGQAVLLIEAVDLANPESAELAGRFVGASLAVGDIRRAYETLRSNGVQFTSAPQRQVWGGLMTHFYDPDENLLTLVE